MKPEDKNNFRIIIPRMGMYIGEVTREKIVSFIHGYDCGSGRNISDLIAEFLENEFKIPRKALGWPHQVEVFGDKNDLDWIESFKKIFEKLMEKPQHQSARVGRLLRCAPHSRTVNCS